MGEALIENRLPVVLKIVSAAKYLRNFFTNFAFLSTHPLISGKVVLQYQ